MKTTLKILLLAFVYAVAGKWGLKLAIVNASATAVWPPAGIALAALLVLGYEVWPGIFLGAFFVNAMTAGTMATSLGIAMGNTLESLLAAFLVNRFARGREAFNHPFDVFKYAVYAALGSTIVSATIGVTTLSLGGFARWVDYAAIWTTWWLGDASGILIVAPFLILWTITPRYRWSSKKAIEAVLVGACLVVVGVAVFGLFSATVLKHYPLEFLCIPVVVWAAFRLGRRGAATAAFLLSVLAIWGTLHGLGPFAVASPNVSLLLLQLYMGVVSVMSLEVAAVVTERLRAQEDLESRVQERTASLVDTIGVLEREMNEHERTEQALRASEIRFHRLMESNVIGIIAVDEEGRISEANDAFLKLLDSSREQMLKGDLNAFALTPLEYRAQEAWAMEQMRTRGSCPALEKEFIHRDGSRIPVLIGGVLLDRIPERSVYFVIDVKHRRQAMEALRKAYDEIELRVEKRTEELSRVNEELSREIARRQEAEAELRTLSLLDPLTGLYNRRGFLALAEQQWLQAYRDKRSFFLFFADVDGLKAINDSLGHAKGDQALEETADILRHTFRKSDILARIGGDEFAVVATQAPLDQAQAYLDRLQDHFHQINGGGKLPFKLTLSVGVAMFDQLETTSIQELMRRADEDLYVRKRLRVIS